MIRVTQTRRMKEALQEIRSTAKLFKDTVYMWEVITRIKKLTKAALQKSPTRDTSAIWKMMNWRSR